MLLFKVYLPFHSPLGRPGTGSWTGQRNAFSVLVLGLAKRTEIVGASGGCQQGGHGRAFSEMVTPCSVMGCHKETIRARQAADMAGKCHYPTKGAVQPAMAKNSAPGSNCSALALMTFCTAE